MFNEVVEQMVDGYEAVYRQIIGEKFFRNGHFRVCLV
ncbi:hypothetical protein NSTC745_07188 [Nostoc sp. DSM 114161]|jgi:hypothetical protein